MRSKSIALIALAIVVVGVAAFLFLKEKAPSGTKAKTVLSFWHIQNYSPTKEIVDAAIKRFTDVHPDVEVAANAIRNDQYKMTLQNAFGAGQAPDVFHTWGGGVLQSFHKAGLVRELDGLFADKTFHDRFLPAALSFAYIDGHPLCAPADMAVVVFFYDKTLFGKLNVAPPKTMSELLATCATLRAASYEPIALGNVDKWPGCFYYVYGVIRNGGRADIERAVAGDASAFSSPSFLKAGETVAGLVRLNVFNTGFQGMKDDAARRLMFNRTSPMTVMGNWFIANASKEAPDMFPQIGVFPFPAADDRPDDGGVVGGINCAYAVSSACKNPKLAEELVSYLTDASFAADWAKIGRIPAVRGAADADFLPATREAFAILEKATYVQMYFDQLFAPELGEKHKETVQALMSGSMTPAQVCAALKETAERMAGKK
ncbi:MAG: extracellular solute-binding protein [Candidatus Brocadiia bacterium]